MAFDSLVSRDDAVADLPDLAAEELVLGVTSASTALTLGRTVKTATKDSRIPILSHAPEAYWVTGDSGLKGVDKFSFDDQSVMAEELAVIIPVPDSVLDDSEIPLWSQLRPLLVRAIARRLDAAVLFGQDKPASWTSPSLLDDATAAGNVITTNPTTDDPVSAVLDAAEMISADGYVPSGAVTRPGWQYRAASVRARDLVSNPVGSATPFPITVAGLGIYPTPPFWQPTAAEAIIADWSNVIIGLRQDIRIETFSSGVISDDAGRIVINLLQQDTSAVRCTFRVGYLLAHPVNDGPVNGSPVAAVVPAGASS